MSPKSKRETGGLVVAESKKKERLARPRLYKVLLHNDDYTTVEFVIDVLTRVFRKSAIEAADLTMKVHTNGVAVAGVYTYEIAETKAAQVMRDAAEQEFPFLCTLEPADDAESE